MTTLGKYELQDEIGRGGFAVVYRAVDTRLNREVALKVLNASLSEDPRFVQQFLHEARTAANLKHSNIVVIHEADEAGGRQYLAMELLPGLDLRRRIERDGPLPLPLVVIVIEQVASALAHAYGSGLVHRDVKSANIILDDTGHATLTDFGLVRAVEGSTYGSSLSLSGGFAGTVEYMSPEQADGQPATAKSDLYALGIVAYEMVTGQVPFKADTPVAVAHKQAYESPPDPRRLRPELPNGMRTAILKALAKKPADRQVNVASFAQALRQGLETAESRRQTATATAAESKPDGRAGQSIGGADWRPARLGGRWLAVGLGAAGLVGVVVIVIVLGLLIGNLNASRGLAATQAAMLRGFATDSAPATTLAPPTAAPPTITPTLLPPSATPTNVPPTATLPSPTLALGIGSTQVSPADDMVEVYVPAGNFLMGSVDSDSQADGDEKPQHTVYLDAFWIDRTDVTNAMYARCVSAGACQAPTDKSSVTHSSYYDNPTYGDYPVIYVSWNDANTYCGWAGRRLPTEAEWEKAARGTDGRLYPWGNAAPNGTLLNYNRTVGDTTAVGQYPSGASPYGALDMAGNVYQWVADWYSDGYYAQSPSRDPTGPASGQIPVMRGGSWFPDALHVRAADRIGFFPGNRNIDIGFRCATSAVDKGKVTAGSPTAWITVSAITASPLAPSQTPMPTITQLGHDCPAKNKGDANCDGRVNGIDYSIWLNSQCRAAPGQQCSDLRADFNGDGNVDDADYSIWFANRE